MFLLLYTYYIPTPFISAVCGNYLEPVCDGHEVRIGGTRGRAAVQVVRLHELPVQSQVAVQDIRSPCAAVQGTSSRISSVSPLVVWKFFCAKYVAQISLFIILKFQHKLTSPSLYNSLQMVRALRSSVARRE